jgi:hypothetical protein
LIAFSIGYNSSGKLINKDLLCLDNLFISFIETPQVKYLYDQILDNAFSQMNDGLLICKSISLLNIDKYYKVETYVYDNPLSGSVQKKNKLFNKIFREFNKLKIQQQPIKIRLIVIDNIWELMPKLTRQNLKQLKQLLAEGANYGIHFIIGSSMPFRNLLLQLMTTSEDQSKLPRSPLNQLGAEIIYNPDEMIFFREKNQLQFESYYPFKMQIPVH